MNKYLLVVREGVGNRYETLNHVLVDATSPGYAKYHWHKLMNEQGASKQDKHYYQHHDLGFWAELEGVREVSEDELDVLERVVSSIPGFEPDT